MIVLALLLSRCWLSRIAKADAHADAYVGGKASAGSSVDNHGNFAATVSLLQMQVV
jgi:hypothetical protein